MTWLHNQGDHRQQSKPLAPFVRRRRGERQERTSSTAPLPSPLAPLPLSQCMEASSPPSSPLPLSLPLWSLPPFPLLLPLLLSFSPLIYPDLSPPLLSFSSPLSFKQGTFNTIMASSDDRRSASLGRYRQKLLEHREAETKLKQCKCVWERMVGMQGGDKERRREGVCDGESCPLRPLWIRILLFLSLLTYPFTLCAFLPSSQYVWDYVDWKRSMRRLRMISRLFSL